MSGNGDKIKENKVAEEKDVSKKVSLYKIGICQFTSYTSPHAPALAISDPEPMLPFISQYGRLEVLFLLADFLVLWLAQLELLRCIIGLLGTVALNDRLSDGFCRFTSGWCCWTRAIPTAASCGLEVAIFEALRENGG